MLLMMMEKTRPSKHERAVRAEIAAVGGVIESERWGKHLNLTWKLGREKFLETISMSPSDPNATKVARQLIRRRARYVHTRSAGAV